MIRQELSPVTCNKISYLYKDENIYIYRTTVATSCDLNAPRCTTEVLRVRLHGSRGGVFIGHRPPRDPGDPPHIDRYIYINKVVEVLHLYRCVTHTHTSHTTYHHTQLITIHNLLFHTQLTPPQSFTISFLFPAFHMPSLPFFCCLLEEVDMWGYPVL